ncbi:hypothetical protein DM01DRAFT_1340138 [Hesseltinella vesiculosa]|uniref:Biogenesis of lysosome-related organelles complex 1 subunit 7 n=1 Tax=Hesseltinella vesiculosa TaxID=101127 RepID=A0A1X2G570_9FUNG|nr:hypothetical protein DM01DRAFT_1340138 [Hesseltinella vesiculosa]
MADNVETLANDISNLLGPIVIEMDKNIVATQQSQQELSQEIERLIAELEVFSDIAEPPRLQPALDKLTEAKKKMANAIKLLQQTTRRMDAIQSSLGPS